jgi:hypothetical protein
MAVRRYELTEIARHDHGHCLAPIFRSLSPGERRRQKLHVEVRTNNGIRMEFVGPEPLGVLEMRVLQGLVALAGLDGMRLPDRPQTPVGRALRQRMEHQRWRDDDIAVKTTWRRLMHEIGMSVSGRSQKLVRKALERLYTVTVFLEKGDQRVGCRLLALYASDDEELYVSLNPVLTRAVLGGRHVRIDMREVRALKSDPARLIHQRLCAWINPGKSRRVSLQRLASYVWPTKAREATERKRRERVRKALQELQKIGWTVQETRRGVFEIGRPAL